MAARLLESVEALLRESGVSVLVTGKGKACSAMPALRHGTVQSCAGRVEQSTSVKVTVVAPAEWPGHAL